MRSLLIAIIIDRLIRSKRRTIALVINRDGTLTVRAPLRARQKHILEFVEQKENWIRSKQAFVQAMYPDSVPKKYISGEKFYYLGEQYPLMIVEDLRMLPDVHSGRSTGLHFSKDGFYLTRSALPRAPHLFKSWYRKQAFQIIGERVRMYALRYGFSYKQIKITSAKTRWGSCSAKNTLSFTWRLGMAPLAAIDYVVVHELAHTVEKNHRRCFWDTVEKILPDYKQQVKWMNINGRAFYLD